VRADPDLAKGRSSVSQEVIIAGWMDYGVADRDIVLKHLQTVGERTREEPGCLDYAMSADATDPHRIRVFECWTSQEALDEHLTTAHVLALRAAIADLPRLRRSLNRYVVESGVTFR